MIYVVKTCTCTSEKYINTIRLLVAQINRPMGSRWEKFDSRTEDIIHLDITDLIILHGFTPEKNLGIEILNKVKGGNAFDSTDSIKKAVSEFLKNYK